MRRAPLALALIALAGCASTPPARVPEPGSTARAYFAAVKADNADAAYALLDPALRAELERERFDRLWRENRTEMLELAAAAERTDSQVVAHARAELADGEEVVLVLQEGQWRVAGGVVDAQALGSPMDAVIAMRRALKRQSLPSLLRVLSRERQAAWLASFEETMDRTSDPLDLRVEVSGDEAIVHTSDGGEIHLKREAGKWRVWDVR